MTENEWATCKDIQDMLYVFYYEYRGPIQRKLRLFTCACCRSMWPEFRDSRLSDALEVACRFADGLVEVRDLEAAMHALAIPDDPAIAIDRITLAVSGCLHPDIKTSCAMTAYQIANINGPRAAGAEAHRQCHLIRDIYGPLPFRPVVVEPKRLSWNHRTVPAIALRIYEERAFHDLPILADALEDAGCTDADLLGHCRGPGPHVRGCWVVDLLLGRE